MKKFKIPLIAICLILLAMKGYSATDLFSVGRSADSNLVKITSTGIVEGARADYTVTSTHDTLTAIESGITEICNVTGTQVTLPSASLGLEYTIVAASLSTVSVAPQDDDTIRYLSLHAGDEIDSPGNSDDSVTVICGAANTWYIKSMTGTWTDGGAD